jgi:heptosyltransferase I
MRANVVSLFVRAKVRLGFDRARARDRQWLFTNKEIPAKSRQHVMDSFFGFIEALGLNERNMRWDIPIPESDREVAGNLVGDRRPLCVISPCSNQRFRNFRNWSAENYIALVNRLHAAFDANVILTGGPTDYERDYGRQIESGANFEIANLIGRTSLKQLLAIIESADLLICPDSGPGHMATAVGTPVVGLFATTNRHRAAPYFSQDLIVDEYPQAVRREYGKSVDEMRWGLRVRDPNAMNLIQVDSVIDKAAMVLKPPGAKGSRPGGADEVA